MEHPTITLIGAGRVGGALAAAATQHEESCILVDRHRGWESLTTTTGPILVTVRNDDLQEVLVRVPGSRRDDLVFVQNGMLRDWLAQEGLAHATRGLLFFAVPSRGAPIDPGGTSVFWGRHAAVVVRFLTALQISAQAVETRPFAVLELEKLTWNAAFGLLCERFKTAVGVVVEAHAQPMHALLEELIDVGDRALDLGLSAEERGAMVARLTQYSLSIPSYRGAVKEWPWRNGWFVEQAQRLGRATPHHDALLHATGHP